MMRMVICALFLLSCGKANPYPYILPPTQKDTFDVHLSLGKALYDRRDFENAYIHLRKAVDLNPLSEEAVIALGFTEVGIAGVEIFSLIKKIKEAQDKKKENPDSSQNSLSLISSVLGVTDEEFSQLGEKNTDDPDLPVMVPLCAEEARVSLRRLYLVTDAIQAVCPFVDTEVRSSSDHRHDCFSVGFIRKRRESAHFLWGIAHLLEAIAFNQVLSYSTTGSAKTNLELRVEKIQNVDITNTANIVTLVSNLESLSTLITKILPVEGLCSDLYPSTQLNALLTDLVSVSEGFAKVAGAPPEVTESIREMVDKINQAKAAGSGVSQASAQTGALKGDFTKNISKALREKINSVDKSTYSADQVNQLCSSYSNISGGDVVSTDKPAVCN